jgi:hypothetical protein
MIKITSRQEMSLGIEQSGEPGKNEAMRKKTLRTAAKRRRKRNLNTNFKVQRRKARLPNRV